MNVKDKLDCHIKMRFREMIKGDSVKEIDRKKQYEISMLKHFGMYISLK